MKVIGWINSSLTGWLDIDFDLELLTILSDLIFTKGLFNDAISNKHIGLPKLNKVQDDCFSKVSFTRADKRAKSSSTVKSSRNSYAQEDEKQLLKEKINFFLENKEKGKPLYIYILTRFGLALMVSRVQKSKIYTRTS